jgi:hypothetical protein
MFFFAEALTLCKPAQLQENIYEQVASSETAHILLTPTDPGYDVLETIHLSKQ